MLFVFGSNSRGSMLKIEVSVFIKIGCKCSLMVCFIVLLWVSFFCFFRWVWCMSKMVLFIISFSKIIKLIMVNRFMGWKVKMFMIWIVIILFIVVSGIESIISMLFFNDLNNFVINSSSNIMVKRKLLVIEVIVFFKLFVLLL